VRFYLGGVINDTVQPTGCETPMSDASLSFEVCVAATESDLADACRVRALAYGRHLGEAAVAGFAHADAQDRAPGTVVLLCRDKASGQAIGTARIQPNAPRLLVERCVILPHTMASQRRAEVTRLAVLPGASPLVKLAMMKAVWLYCQAQAIDWLVICARSEALARNYRMLGFKDYLAPGEMLPLPYAGHIPHVVLTMQLSRTQAQWRQHGHRLQAFMLESSFAELPRFQPQPQVALAQPAAPRHLA
jgi:hypothetical protein